MAKGVDFVIKINTGTDAAPVYTQVAGQKGGTLNRDADTLDVTTKDNYGWADSEYGLLSWSIESDGLLVENDLGYAALETAFMGKQPVIVYLQTPSGKKYQGKAIITSFPIDVPHDESATYSVTFTGKGALTKL